MQSRIDHMVLLTCAVTKTDTVLKESSPHLVHREKLLLIFQVHKSRFYVLVLTSPVIYPMVITWYW